MPFFWRSRETFRSTLRVGFDGGGGLYSWTMAERAMRSDRLGRIRRGKWMDEKRRRG